MNKKELPENKNSPRPNEHRAWFVDAFVIDFLWKKGWSCCKAEACDWWYNINQHLKKDLFASEQEWKDFKEKGIYPIKHQTNWAKLNSREKIEVEKLCWDSEKNRWHREQLMAYTLQKISQKNHDRRNE